MKTKLLVAAALLVSFGFGPGVAAEHGQSCDDVEDESAAAVPAGESGEVGDIYVTDEPGVYEETNDIPGLQTEAGHCDGEDFDADTVVVSASDVPEPPEPPL